jgi:hypothetical protein
MSPGARLLYIELRGRLRNDYLNNGKVFLSCRDAAKAIGVSTQSIVRWYAENEHYGFLRKTDEGFLGTDGYGIAARYRFTEFAHGTHPATRDFEKWDGEIFVYTPRRPSRKKQNPVLMVSTPRADGQHIRRGRRQSSLCAHGQHIGTAGGCDDGQHISRSATRERSDGVMQGSSTARAPARAGDAGSSPAPVANSLTETLPSGSEQVPAPAPAPPPAPPWVPHSQRDIDHERHSREGLMGYVADVIEKQLQNLDEAREARHVLAMSA